MKKYIKRKTFNTTVNGTKLINVLYDNLFIIPDGVSGTEGMTSSKAVRLINFMDTYGTPDDFFNTANDCFIKYGLPPSKSFISDDRGSFYSWGWDYKFRKLVLNFDLKNGEFSIGYRGSSFYIIQDESDFILEAPIAILSDIFSGRLKWSSRYSWLFNTVKPYAIS